MSGGLHARACGLNAHAPREVHEGAHVAVAPGPVGVDLRADGQALADELLVEGEGVVDSSHPLAHRRGPGQSLPQGLEGLRSALFPGAGPLGGESHHASHLVDPGGELSGRDHAEQQALSFRDATGKPELLGEHVQLQVDVGTGEELHLGAGLGAGAQLDQPEVAVLLPEVLVGRDHPPQARGVGLEEGHPKFLVWLALLDLPADDLGAVLGERGGTPVQDERGGQELLPRRLRDGALSLGGGRQHRCKELQRLGVPPQPQKGHTPVVMEEKEVADRQADGFTVGEVAQLLLQEREGVEVPARQEAAPDEVGMQRHKVELLLRLREQALQEGGRALRAPRRTAQLPRHHPPRHGHRAPRE